jgi:hypothetical protein
MARRFHPLMLSLNATGVKRTPPFRKKWAALPVTGVALLLWLGAALGLWYGVSELMP